MANLSVYFQFCWAAAFSDLHLFIMFSLKTVTENWVIMFTGQMKS